MAFRRETKTHKAIHVTLVTTYGVQRGKYAYDVQSEVTMDDLFAPPVNVQVLANL
ncbi:MAG: hypothetical protein LBR77_02335 [Lachnospiraceae bacterium]|jgi:hypothetical protein|nr:hypothetical protein [Lachnospiraceae bacterium]